MSASWAPGASCSTAASIMYTSRSSEAPAFAISDSIRPSRRMGKDSMPLYEIKATYSPAESCPRTASTAPYTVTSRICKPHSTSCTAKNRPITWPMWTHREV